MSETKKLLKLKNVELIYAISLNNVMGKNGTLPWICRADMRYFRETTSGHAVVMGRHTFESMDKKLLPNRINIVITSQKNYDAPGAIVVDNLYDAYAEACKFGVDKKLFIIGGKRLLEEGIYIASKIHVSTISRYVELEGEIVYGPNLDEELKQFTISHNQVLRITEEEPAAHLMVFS